ncbi:MAG: YiiX/YebB-like N1pC/P60 family cysteine hydrolase [Candidatus Sericytochromatia bacterium]
MKPISTATYPTTLQSRATAVRAVATTGAARPSAATPGAKPSAASPGSAPPLRAKPAAVAKREFVARVEPKDTLWYRFKRAFADIMCNIDLPTWASRTLGSTVPDGLKSQLQPGDVLLRRTEGTSGNYFIPSWWKHAAVYVGNGKVVEATFSGVKTTSLKEFFDHGDHAAVVRAKDLTEKEQKAMAKFAKRQEGKPYDFDVDFNDASRLTCTELAYQALKAVKGKEVAQQNWFGAVVGDSFLTDKFEVVFTSSPEHTVQ